MQGRTYLEPGTVLDTYRIGRVVGAGGFGVTYEAEDVNLRTTLAIKEYFPEEFATRTHESQVRPSSDRQSETFEWGRSGFLEEARTLARFRHPSIVQIYRIFEANSTAYMVMAFERGPSFAKWLRDLGRMPTQEELDRLVNPLLDALEAMHANNVLHRDIAPDNIIIRENNTPVLLDFGAARKTVAAKTQALTGVFKHGYSPQEQYSTEGKFQGPWSDFYALGATLYRAVTGTPPEEAPSRSIHDSLVPAARAAKGEYRPSFLAGIDACLKLRPADRPQTAAQARALFNAAPGVERTRLLDLPKAAMQAPTAATPSKGFKIEIAIAAASLVVILMAGGGLWYKSWSEDNARRLEQQRFADARAAAEARQRAEAERVEREERERQQRAEAQINDAKQACTSARGEQALDACTRAIEMAPNFAAAYLSRGNAYMDRGAARRDASDHDRAIADFIKVIGLEPNNAVAYNNRGNAYKAKGEAGRAIIDYTKAIELNPNMALAYYNRGLALHAKGDSDAAIADYTKVIGLNPNDASAYLERGIAHRARRNYESAISDYNRVISLEPNNANAYNNRGNVYKDKNEIERSIIDYTRAIEINGTFALAYGNRGSAYQAKGDNASALNDYNRVITLEPRNATAFLRRGLVHHARREFDSAIYDYTQVLAIEPRAVAAFNNRGNVYRDKGDIDRAIADYDRAIEINPRYALGYNNRSLAYKAKGDIARSNADRAKAVELGYASTPTK